MTLEKLSSNKAYGGELAKYKFKVRAPIPSSQLPGRYYCTRASRHLLLHCDLLPI
jgi:hypothetical protein